MMLQATHACFTSFYAATWLGYRTSGGYKVTPLVEVSARSLLLLFFSFQHVHAAVRRSFLGVSLMRHPAERDHKNMFTWPRRGPSHRLFPWRTWIFFFFFYKVCKNSNILHTLHPPIPIGYISTMMAAFLCVRRCKSCPVSWHERSLKEWD